MYIVFKIEYDCSVYSTIIFIDAYKRICHSQRPTLVGWSCTPISRVVLIGALCQKPIAITSPGVRPMPLQIQYYQLRGDHVTPTLNPDDHPDDHPDDRVIRVNDRFVMSVTWSPVSPKNPDDHPDDRFPTLLQFMISVGNHSDIHNVFPSQYQRQWNEAQAPGPPTK